LLMKEKKGGRKKATEEKLPATNNRGEGRNKGCVFQKQAISFKRNPMDNKKEKGFEGGIKEKNGVD